MLYCNSNNLVARLSLSACASRREDAKKSTRWKVVSMKNDLLNNEKWRTFSSYQINGLEVIRTLLRNRCHQFAMWSMPLGIDELSMFSWRDKPWKNQVVSSIVDDNRKLLSESWFITRLNLWLTESDRSCFTHATSGPLDSTASLTLSTGLVVPCFPVKTSCGGVDILTSNGSLLRWDWLDAPREHTESRAHSDSVHSPKSVQELQSKDSGGGSRNLPTTTPQIFTGLDEQGRRIEVDPKFADYKWKEHWCA